MLFDGRPSQPPDACCEAADYVTRNPFARVDVPPSGLVTVTLRTPVAAVEDTETLRVNLDEF